jgi:hypothetical protein
VDFIYIESGKQRLRSCWNDISGWNQPPQPIRRQITKFRSSSELKPRSASKTRLSNIENHSNEQITNRIDYRAATVETMGD